MNPETLRRARATALSEIEKEDMDAEVERLKAQIRARRSRPFWHRLIPFTVTIKRRT